MKILKVGGAVRDFILGIEPKDIDYVVVGATPEQMIEQGYKQVGADFPVFLKDGCEYALARRERKVGVGYHGFETEFDPSVTLEDDLSRRDLTINSMAMDDDGNIIDPFGGINDLKNKVLRHTSIAFCEDPLRVLRIARFSARFVGFNIQEETFQLMKSMVIHGELSALTKERVWLEFEKAFKETKPFNFIAVLIECNALKEVFPELHKVAEKHPIKFIKMLSECERLTSNEERLAYIMTIFPKDQIKSICVERKISNEIRDMALDYLTFEELYEKTSVSTVECFDYFNVGHNSERFFRTFDMFNTISFESQKNFRIAKWLTIAYSDISFLSLSNEQQKTLKGPEIKRAIFDLRVERLKSTNADPNTYMNKT